MQEADLLQIALLGRFIRHVDKRDVNRHVQYPDHCA